MLRSSVVTGGTTVMLPVAAGPISKLTSSHGRAVRTVALSNDFGPGATWSKISGVAEAPTTWSLPATVTWVTWTRKRFTLTFQPSTVDTVVRGVDVVTPMLPSGCVEGLSSHAA